MMRQKLYLLLSMVAVLSGMAAAAMPNPLTLGIEQFEYADGPIAGKNGGQYWNWIDKNTTPGVSSWVDRIVVGTAGTVTSQALVTNNSGAQRGYTPTNHWEDVVWADRVVYCYVKVTPLTNQAWFGVDILDWDTARVSFGLPDTGGSLGNFGINDVDNYNRTPTGIFRTTTPVVMNQTYILLCAVDYIRDQCRMWINPSGSDYDNLVGGVITTSADITMAYNGSAWNSGIRLSSSGQVRWDNLGVVTSTDTSGFNVIMGLFPTTAPINLAPTGIVFKPTIPNQLTWDAPQWDESMQPHIVSIAYKLDYYSKLTSNVVADDPNFAKPANNIVTVASATSPHALDFAYSTTYFWRVTATTTWDSNSVTGNWTDVDSAQERFDVQAEDTAPVPNAGKSIVTWLEKAQSGIQLAGTVNDVESDGTTKWEAYSASFPAVIPAPEVAIATPSSLTTTVTISSVGEYIMKLTATDDTPSIPPQSSQMKITVYADACTAAKKNPAGYTKHIYDYDDNCQVDIGDLLTVAAKWLNSTALATDGYFAATVGDPSQGLVAEYWTGISGTDPNSLLNDPRYPNNPNGTDFIAGQFKQGGRSMDNYGQRIRGYIIAPTTGSYIFYISSDDSSRLFLSTDTNPANAVQIAYVSGSTGLDEWTKFPATQTSAAITLNAGQYYYVEVIMKEGTGNDWVSVGWSTDNGTTKTVIPGSALRWYLQP